MASAFRPRIAVSKSSWSLADEGSQGLSVKVLLYRKYRASLLSVYKHEPSIWRLARAIIIILV